MEVGRATTENKRMRFEDVSMERSKSFVLALQELKNLRPQLYSAADYCEKSYLNSEKKQMILDNLKDYAARALVNAIDHLGTVSYRLSNVIEQQTVDMSSMELKLTCLNQRILTCQTYTEKEGVRQQKILSIIPRHHKHYIFANSLNKVHFSPHIQTEPKQTIQAEVHRNPSGASSAASTLSWHLASKTKSKGSPRGIISTKDSKAPGKNFEAFNLLDGEVNSRKKTTPASTIAMQTRRDFMEGYKPSTPYRSFTNTPQSQIVRSKSMFSVFFPNHKMSKAKLSSRT